MNTLDQKDGYIDCCSVCGHTGYLCRQEDIASIRENYRCTVCKASLRYREQARLIIDHFSREDSEHLAELVNETAFRNLQIYEPGLIGPFRKILDSLPGYHSSYFWNDVKPGEFREGVQCQNLMNLTYEDDIFDLVLSSDIFEHVRKPYIGLREIDRVFKLGGYHIFSIPVQNPMPSKTVFRVDTRGASDVFILAPHYHSAPMGGRSLVYTDFGADMVQILANDGIDLQIESPCSPKQPIQINDRMLSFYWKKPGYVNDSKAQIHRELNLMAGTGVTCNICGSSQFKEGPLGRKSLTGKLPQCARCGSLERHRFIRSVWNQVIDTDFISKKALQFSRDPTVERKWFGNLEVSVYGGRNSLDLRDIDRAAESYDIVICNHVLAHVRDDSQAFREIMRILIPDGFLQFSVPGSMTHTVTEDWGYSKPELHHHYRMYGRDVVQRFTGAQPEVHILEVYGADGVTGSRDVVYFATFSNHRMTTLSSRLQVQTESSI